MLNEQLYTTNSKISFEYFRQNEDDFKAYHEGFARQVKDSNWTKNPLDIFIRELQKHKYADKKIADLGCGEGRLAEEVKAEVLSYDIGKLKPHVIQADIANVILSLLLAST